MIYCKFVDGKGSTLYDVNTQIIPRVGEHVQIRDQQYPVTRVLIVYTISSDWAVVTVDTPS